MCKHSKWTDFDLWVSCFLIYIIILLAMYNLVIIYELLKTSIIHNYPIIYRIIVSMDRSRYSKKI